MKRVFILSVSMLTLSAISNAQTTFGIKAGVQSTELRITGDANDEHVAIAGGRTGFVFGGTADIKLGTNWSFQPHLLLAMKNGSIESSANTNILAIDIPLNVLYRQGGFFVGAGPNLSYGLSGKLKSFSGGDDQDLYEEEGGNEAFFKRFEFGVNALMGYEFNGGFVLSANFTPGLSDIFNQDDSDYKVHNRMVGLNIGYLFNKGAAKKK